jgi:hypothetical protein
MMTYKEDRKHIDQLRFMLSILMERQSYGWLKDEEREECRKGIVALQRAVDVIGTQYYA